MRNFGGNLTFLFASITYSKINQHTVIGYIEKQEAQRATYRAPEYN